MINPACRCIDLADAGCIVGTLFHRHGMAKPVTCLTSTETAAISTSGGDALLRRYWGAYVAAIAAPDRTDPSGSVRHLPLLFRSPRRLYSVRIRCRSPRGERRNGRHRLWGNRTAVLPRECSCPRDSAKRNSRTFGRVFAQASREHRNAGAVLVSVGVRHGSRRSAGSCRGTAFQDGQALHSGVGVHRGPLAAQRLGRPRLFRHRCMPRWRGRRYHLPDDVLGRSCRRRAGLCAGALQPSSPAAD